MKNKCWELPLGAHKQKNRVHFRVWAPKAKTVTVVMQGSQELQYPMHPTENGYFELLLKDLPNKIDYLYCLDGEKRRPDPASRWQPYGVHGPSRVYDPQEFTWEDVSWNGIPLKEYILYEIHVGTFTPEGTFEAIIEKLPHLKDLGITAIELMPVIEFPGDRNWGYDGVYPYAPHHRYGGPSGLKRLINACHLSNIAVALDVVYNHLGPEGNYLADYGHYFTNRYKTPWGDAVNFDGPYSDGVRNYFINNALYWLTEYHVDALRLDAIHSIFDFSAQHILKEIQTAFHKQAKTLDRQAFIIAESDLNDVRIINPLQKGGYDVDAQWNDDFHHAIHAVLTKSRNIYFEDFGQLSQIAKAISNGFVYEGQWSEYRKRHFGSSSQNLPGEKFVVCLQNHDQIENASQGKRLANLITLDQYKLATILLFCAPNLPFLFMGQEWNASSPFFYFMSFDDKKLIKNINDGYQKEHAIHDAKLDLHDESRFLQSKLNWSELTNPQHEEILGFYKQCIALRKKLPSLSNCRKDLTQVKVNQEREWLILERGDPDHSKLVLLINFSSKKNVISVPFPQGHWDLLLSNTEASPEIRSFSFEITSDIPEKTISLSGFSFLLWVSNNNEDQ